MENANAKDYQQKPWGGLIHGAAPISMVCVNGVSPAGVNEDWQVAG